MNRNLIATSCWNSSDQTLYSSIISIISFIVGILCILFIQWLIKHSHNEQSFIASLKGGFTRNNTSLERNGKTLLLSI